MPASSATPAVAFLRGVNVGGKVLVPMADLRAVFAGLGHPDAVTYLQSGNVVFRASADAARDAGRIEAALQARFTREIRVVLRTRGQLATIAGRNPYLGDESEPSKLHVVFLGAAATEAKVADLDPGRSPPDEFTVAGAEIYVHYPNGAGRSKLNIDYFERRLGTVATARNWNTVTKVLDLMDESA